MSKISDIIEDFILDQLEDSGYIFLSRNEMANFFNCAPSQINYVLDTRFTIDRGFVKESKRGGSGYIKISRLKNTDDNEYLNSLVLESVGDELSEKRMVQILEKLVSDNIVSFNEKVLIEAALSEDSLAMPFTIKDKVRAKSFKNILIELMKK